MNQEHRVANARAGSAVKLAYFVSHPIQYQAPLLRRIAQEPGIDLTVYFASDHSMRGYRDEGFGVEVAWDVPLVEGYRHEFLPRRGTDGQAAGPGFARPWNSGIFDRLERGHFDAVWVHGYHTATQLRAIVAASTLRVPVLLRAESTLGDRPRGGARLMAKAAFFCFLRQHIQAVLPIGTANARYWRHYVGPEVPSFPVPYAVDNHFFQQRAQAAEAGREELRRELALEPGRPVILFASKLQPRKRCGDLIAAVRALKQSGDKERHRPYLLVVGDGEERTRLEQEATDCPEVRFLGFRNQTELPRFFDLCEVFVLPSVDEPWGLVVNEAMNAARAVIVSDAVGCQEDLLCDGVNGCVFPARDVKALAGALERVLGSPERSASHGPRKPACCK